MAKGIGRQALTLSGCGLAAVLVAAPVGGTEPPLAGPIPAALVRVVDGDTIDVRARIWLRQEVETKVRLLDIDAPELKGHCASERKRALEAKRFVETLLASGALILRDVRFDKYGGRVVARIETPDGRDLGRALIEAGLGRAYDGHRRQPWCDPGETENISAAER